MRLGSWYQGKVHFNSLYQINEKAPDHYIILLFDRVCLCHRTIIQLCCNEWRHFNKSIQAFIGIRPNADGLFESFDEGSFVLIDYKIVTDPDNVFLKEAFRIARLVPDWDVIYRKNEILSQQLVIIFDKRMKKHVHK